MANELLINYPTGATLYALLFDATGQVWNGSAFAAPGSAAWTDYDIAMTEVATATGLYRGSMPAAAAGSYSFVVRKQAGASPAVSDIAVGSGEIRWTGTAEETVPPAVNVTYLAGQSEPLDNLVLALGHTDGIVAHPQGLRDALKLAPTAGTPADGSVDDHLDDLAAALAAATSTLTVVSAVDGGVINIYQAVSFQATISGLAIPAGWTKVYWTVKRATSEADTDAILQMVETNPSAGTDGLLRVNGAAGTAGNGSLTVDQAAGTVVIDLIMTVCDDLALATGLVWSLKALHPTSAATLLATGTVNVLGQATAAVA
jgi:hypothetical protein